MSRSLRRRKICVYCAKNIAKTDDHVFSREFFLVRDRHNLPKVPACGVCNGAKSKLEHYLTVVLPFAARRSQAVENLRAGVPRRLAKNQKLRKVIEETSRHLWVQEESGIYQRTRMFSFDMQKLRDLIDCIARGLAWYHWRVYLKPDRDEVTALFFEDMGSVMLASVINEMNPAVQVHKKLGNGTVEYVGFRSASPPELTIWTIRMYGGIVMTDDVSVGKQVRTCSLWWAITGPQERHNQVTAALNRRASSVTHPTAPA